MSISSSTVDRYHHGDLRAALLTAASESLEEGDEAGLSLRAVARRAGVSPNAPYRHFPNKDALLAALATQGYHELRRRLVEADACAPAGGEFAALTMAYVNYAVQHPNRFRLMFGHPCTRSSPETSAAAAATAAVLDARVAAAIPADEREAFTIGSWSLAHGFAMLIIDGKIPIDSHNPAQRNALVASLVMRMTASTVRPVGAANATVAASPDSKISTAV